MEEEFQFPIILLPNKKAAGTVIYDTAARKMFPIILLPNKKAATYREKDLPDYYSVSNHSTS